MKTLKIKEATRQECKRDYRRSNLPDTFADYYVNNGVWYRFSRTVGPHALFMECPESAVPPERVELARRFYPGALSGFGPIPTKSTSKKTPS